MPPGDERTRPSSSRPHEATISPIERQLETAVATEPKYLARACLLLHDIARRTGRVGEAAHIRGIFDESGLVLFHLAGILRTIRATIDGADPASELLTGIDDVVRLMRITVDDEEPLLHLLQRVRGALTHPASSNRRAQLIGDVDRLERHVNEFFFDRLTTMSSLRDQIVALELGLPLTERS